MFMHVNLKDFLLLADLFSANSNCDEFSVAFGSERYIAGDHFLMSSF
jgi:hypothetical protein